MPSDRADQGAPQTPRRWPWNNRPRRAFCVVDTDVPCTRCKAPPRTRCRRRQRPTQDHAERSALANLVRQHLLDMPLRLVRAPRGAPEAA